MSNQKGGKKMVWIIQTFHSLGSEMWGHANYFYNISHIILLLLDYLDTILLWYSSLDIFVADIWYQFGIRKRGLCTYVFGNIWSQRLVNNGIASLDSFYIYIHSCGCLDRKRGGAVVLYVEAACEVQLGPTNCQWLLWPHPQSTRPLRSSPKYFTFRLQTQSPNISFSFHFAQFSVKSFTWNNSILARKLPSQNSQSLLGLFSSILISTKILPQISHEELTAQIVPKFVSFPKNCLSIYCCLASEEEAAQIVHENVPNF